MHYYLHQREQDKSAITQAARRGASLPYTTIIMYFSSFLKGKLQRFSRKYSVSTSQHSDYAPLKESSKTPRPKNSLQESMKHSNYAPLNIPTKTLQPEEKSSQSTHSQYAPLINSGSDRLQ